MELLLLLAAAAWLYRAHRRRAGRRPAPRRTRSPAPRRRRPATGSAGASATAHAARLRQRARGGPLRQLLTAAGLNINNRRTAPAAARRYEAGGVGEQRTTALLEELGTGWDDETTILVEIEYRHTDALHEQLAALA
ncbi:hypothetical protein E1265_14545 [Streptomyces sp. 8K308]|uniref:hypothetical protein n=1 Tax=Streptomyces sp. 8K308 TaxID=2530388 RepID=UPI00104E86B9|nr:hypothetical protein [Streptomyces sp. 8K308]TDC22831.1 hypothetical protein E1265_14545 [Streptomyces sp. 8K308]